jgi:hypothetical protein
LIFVFRVWEIKAIPQAVVEGEPWRNVVFISAIEGKIRMAIGYRGSNAITDSVRAKQQICSTATGVSYGSLGIWSAGKVTSRSHRKKLRL